MGSADQRCEQLLASARTGEEAALGALLERFRPYLTLQAQLEIGRRLRGKADPTDAVQDAFLEAARQFARFRGGTEPELAACLRQLLATRLAHPPRRYH